MTDEPMDIDTPASSTAPANAMAALMAAAKDKGKGKASEDGGVMTEEELRALNEREGLPWCVEIYTPPEIVCSCRRVEKYRPNTLDDVVSHKDITTTSGSHFVKPFPELPPRAVELTVRSREVY
jgi:replication factor C subunit 3/5